MRNALVTLLLLTCLTFRVRAQFESFTEVPVEVDAEGETRFEGGVAIAEDNVVIRYGDVSIYSDYAQYNPDTRDVFVRGNVRIYRDGRVFVGERAVYNLETKLLRTAEFRGEEAPFLFSAQNVFTTGGKQITVRNATFTTSDSSTPDYYLRSKGVRIYPDDRVIFTRVTLYVGKTPIFWWPYLYQSLKHDVGFSFSPGYESRWGAFLLTKYRFPISDNMSGELRLDLRSERGVGVGFGTDFAFSRGTEETSQSWGRFRAYYADDERPNTNDTSLPRQEVSRGRYRIAFQSQIYLTEDIYATIDINKLSDSEFLEDYEMGLFRLDPQPDNLIALTKWDENWTLTNIVRVQLNDFFTTTERLPDLTLDIKRLRLFGSPIFYEGETGVANLKRSPSDLSDLPGYDAVRFDTFHQLSYPRTYFGWLSIVPKVGVRGTYYSDSGSLRTTEFTQTVAGVTQTQTVTDVQPRGAVFRTVINGGVEASFKLWREYDAVQSRVWGLDGLRHVIQPYTNVSFAYSSEDPDHILQFDRILPSTQLPPIDFPQFNSIDSISDWGIVRFGLRNRFQTRRDDNTFAWLELDTYFDTYIDQPTYAGFDFDQGTFSNVFNRLRWYPLPWMQMTIDSQVPLLDSGFTEVNTRLTFMPNRDLELNIGHRYIDGNPFFRSSNLVSFGAYYQINDNWGFSVRENYEFDDSTLETQVYELHRDLSSWVASLGLVIRDNNGANEYGFLLSFTLKDLPSVTLPLAFDPQAGAGGLK